MNIWLKGNGHWCRDCKGTGRGELSDVIVYESGAECRFYKNCPTCNGKKRLPGPGPEVEIEHTCLAQTIEYVGPHRT